VNERLRDLLEAGPTVANIGVRGFGQTLAEAGGDVVQVDWRPLARGDAEIAAALESVSVDERGADRFADANTAVLERLVKAQPTLIALRPAREVAPVLAEKVLLHAGAPIEWAAMSGPMRGACIGAALYEGWAASKDEAVHQLETGEVAFLPCHTAGGVGPMGGITSGSMPVLVVEDRAGGGRGFCSLNEGMGRVLRFGAYGPDVLERLAWMRDELGPLLGAALKETDGINLRAIMSRGILMGDEFHQRNAAASLLFLRDIAPLLAASDVGRATSDAASRVLSFLGQTDQFFLNLAMAAGKATAESAQAVAAGTVVTAMCRNGVEFGIRVSGLGERWFTAPVNRPDGLYFSGYGWNDGNPDIGDSSITETIGVGGMAMAAAPAVVAYVGAGSFADAVAITREMAEITLGANPELPIATMDFVGAPTGIDVRLVVETGITPIISTGIAHRQAGFGQIGAGTVRAPLACFEAAVMALAEQRQSRDREGA
jgi:hypothetical protein